MKAKSDRVVERGCQHFWLIGGLSGDSGRSEVFGFRPCLYLLVSSDPAISQGQGVSTAVQEIHTTPPATSSRSVPTLTPLVPFGIPGSAQNDIHPHPPIHPPTHIPPPPDTPLIASSLRSSVPLASISSYKMDPTGQRSHHQPRTGTARGGGTKSRGRSGRGGGQARWGGLGGGGLGKGMDGGCFGDDTCESIRDSSL